MTVSCVYRTPRFDRALRDLYSQGGRARLIAEKVEHVVAGLLRGRSITELGKQTRNGEYRIDQCFKLDLGGGYRVVCLLNGKCLVLLYAGAHDECCRWIERSGGMKYDIIDNDHVLPVMKATPTKWTLPPAVEEERRFSEEYEKSIMKRLDDDMLRRVFGCRPQSDCQ